MQNLYRDASAPVLGYNVKTEHHPQEEALEKRFLRAVCMAEDGHR